MIWILVVGGAVVAAVLWFMEEGKEAAGVGLFTAAAFMFAVGQETQGYLNQPEPPPLVAGEHDGVRVLRWEGVWAYENEHGHWITEHGEHGVDLFTKCRDLGDAWEARTLGAPAIAAVSSGL